MRKYMDFVPAEPVGLVKTQTARAKKAARIMPSDGAVRQKYPKMRATEIVRSTEDMKRVDRKVMRQLPRAEKALEIKRPVETKKPVAFTDERNLKLGAIEDLNPKFVKTDVPKRPLSSGTGARRTRGGVKTGVAAVKAQPVGMRAKNANKGLLPGMKPVEKSVENSSTKGVYQPPKSPFINQKKVVKRPLSKNVYAKKIEAPKEEPKGPVTIISKPEKQAHVGMVVTIILTIILGAAAGTVAFLLLPK